MRTILFTLAALLTAASASALEPFETIDPESAEFEVYRAATSVRFASIPEEFECHLAPLRLSRSEELSAAESEVQAWCVADPVVDRCYFEGTEREYCFDGRALWVAKSFDLWRSGRRATILWNIYALPEPGEQVDLVITLRESLLQRAGVWESREYLTMGSASGDQARAVLASGN